MRRNKKGFTIIEVSLFLAITGLLFLSVTIGVQNSIYQQRYNDSIQSFVNFLRNAYDEVLNVQSGGNGRHDEAIYGKLMTFGETFEGSDAEKQSIFMYDVIGMAVSSDELGSGTTLGLLKKIGANVVFREGTGEEFKSVGLVEEFTPSWGARIQKLNSFEDFTGSILIVRDPKSGTVRTFVNNDVIDVTNKVNDLGGLAESQKDEAAANILTNSLSTDNFEMTEVKFCVNPNGVEESNRRAEIKLLEGASNSSGVELVNLDDQSKNECNNVTGG